MKKPVLSIARNDDKFVLRVQLHDVPQELNLALTLLPPLPNGPQTKWDEETLAYLEYSLNNAFRLVQKETVIIAVQRAK